MPDLVRQPSPRPLAWAPLVYTLRDLLAGQGEAVYLVGGVVRDAFWGIPAHDIDLAVARDAFRVARRIADALGGAFYRLDPARETGRAIVEAGGQKLTVDVANFRGGDLLADLRGRDFTLNAVAAPLAGDLEAVIDPLDGLTDAQNRLLRACGPDSVADDPIRALRAVRLSVRFKLRIEPGTLAAIRRDGPRLTDTSPERLRDEFMALLGGPRPAAALRALDALGLLALIVPEVDALRGVTQSACMPRAPHWFDAWTHTLETIRQLDGVLQTISPARTDSTAAQAGLGLIVYFLDCFRAQLQEHLAQPWPNERPHAALLALAALLHDSGKAATQEMNGDRIHFIGHEKVGAALAEARGRALALSNGEIARLAAIVRHHLRPLLLDQEQSVSRRAVYRFWRACGGAGVDVCLLALADYLATVGPTLATDQWSHFLQTIGTLLEGYYGQGAANVAALPALVTGHDLMAALSLQPGPQIGELLEHIREAQAAGEVRTAEEAIALARSHISQR